MGSEYTDELKLDFGPDGKELIPVVTQDYYSREVLILAYASKEAFDETIQSGYATFFSRSRKQIWKKGLTSGNMLKIEEIRTNCEQNSLLYMVTPEGKGACHALKPDGSPHTTCYYRRLATGGKLEFMDQ
jgi:phosphoribosyl-AMP cyclohydrolase